MSIARSEPHVPGSRILGALVGPIGEQIPLWAALGAAGIVALEVLALLVAGVAGPLAALGIVFLPLYALLCWFSLPAAWLLTLAMVPFSTEVLFRGFSSSALWVPTEPMIFIFLAVWGTRALLHGAHRLPRSPIFASIGVLALVAILSALGSRFHFLSFKAILSTGWFAVFAFLFTLMRGGERDFARKALLLVAASGTVFSVYGIVYIAGHGVTRQNGSEMGHPFFPEHGTYSVYLTFAICAVLALALSARRSWWKGLGLASVGIISLAIVLSLTRAAFLGLAAAFGTTLWYLMRARRARTILAVIVLTLAVGYAVSRFRASEFVGLYVASIAQPGELSNLERISRWLAAWNMARAHPLVGVGYGTYADNYYAYRVLTLRTEGSFRYMGVHSEYFRVLSEMGWLGVAALLAFIALVTRQAHLAIRRSRTPADRALAVGLLAGFAGYLVHSAFNSYGESDKIMIPFWLFVAAIAIQWSRTRDPEVAPA